ncbi:MAG: RNA polymerase sigma factor RpoE [Gammaproteobacteria bacterium]|nr:RNA polymerase sigma factor RpoE [Gammaproteobacteria bacterium]
MLSNSDLNDQQLVQRVIKGDKKSFDLLVLKYQQRIVAVVGRYGNNSDEVMDITQETFIKAYRALDRFRGDSSFYTWLYRIAINTAKNYLVAKSRRPPDYDVDVDSESEAISDYLHSSESPENKLLESRLEEVIKRAIARLPQDLKSAIIMREYEGLSYVDISNILECPVGTIRSRIFRARESIEKEISGFSQ